MDFIDWCDLVLDKIIEVTAASIDARNMGVAYQQLPNALFGEDATSKPGFHESKAHLGMYDALNQLADCYLVDEKHGTFYKPTDIGEQVAKDKTELWKAFCNEKLKPEQEQVLRAVNRLSPHEADDHAWVERVGHETLLNELGWSSDRDGLHMLWAVSTELEEKHFVKSLNTMGEIELEATYRGLVWEHRRGVALESKAIDDPAADRETLAMVPFPRSESVQPLLTLPRFRRRVNAGDGYLAFVLMPFESDFNDVLNDAIRPATEDNGLGCQRADDIQNNEEIMEDVWEAIWRCRIVVADLTDQNANVFYEVGIADTVGKEVVLIAQTGRLSRPPFDVAARRVIFYDNHHAGRAKLRSDLAAMIKAVLAKAPAASSPSNADQPLAAPKAQQGILPAVEVRERVEGVWALLDVTNSGERAGRFRATGKLVTGTGQNEDPYSVRWREAYERDILINAGDMQILDIAEALQGSFKTGNVLSYRTFRFHTAPLPIGDGKFSEAFERRQASDSGIVIEISITSEPPMRQVFKQRYQLREGHEPGWQEIRIKDGGEIEELTPPNPIIDFRPAG